MGAPLIRRNPGPLLVRIERVPGEVELLPVCSCCRLRALRPTSGGGRACPDCDRPPPGPDAPPRPVSPEH